VNQWEESVMKGA